MKQSLKKLFVFYDPDCGVCSRFRAWLEARPLWIEVEFVGYTEDRAERLFPGLSKMEADQECVVLADDGHWWQGKEAWLVCLWATREHRMWSFRLATPMFRPLLSRVVESISSHRFTLSKGMGLRSDRELAEMIGRQDSSCCDGVCGRFVERDESGVKGGLRAGGNRELVEKV